MKKTFRPGDFVIYRKTKHSTQPGPRAANVQPAPRGETYAYTVDKFWLVENVLEDGTVVAVTRRGKKNFVPAGSPMLKRANWLEKLIYRARFTALRETIHARSELTPSS